eukprot:c9637_g1_i1 orf=57-869(+)
MVEAGELPLMSELPSLKKKHGQKDPSKTPPWKSPSLLLRASPRGSNYSTNSPLQRLQGKEWEGYCNDFYPSTGGHSGNVKNVDMNVEAFSELDSGHEEECRSLQQETIIDHFDDAWRVSGEQRGWENATSDASSMASNATESHEGGSEEGRDEKAYPFLIFKSNTDGRRCLRPRRLHIELTNYSERTLKRESSYKHSVSCFSPYHNNYHQKMGHEAELMYSRHIHTAGGREISQRTTESRCTKRAPKGSPKHTFMSAQWQRCAPMEEELM